MSQTHTRVLYHFVWATWNREPLLAGEVEPHAYALMRRQCTEAHCVLHAIGGMEDHVHLLVTLPRTLYIAEFMKSVKGVSSWELNKARSTPTWSFRVC